MRQQRPHVTVTLGGVPTPVKAAAVSVDESWSRHVVADLMVPLSDAVLALDVSASPRGRVLAQTWHTTGLSVSDLTALAGGAVAGWTAFIAGVGLAGFTSTLARPLTDYLASVAGLTSVVGGSLAGWSAWLAGRPLGVLTAAIRGAAGALLDSEVRAFDLVVVDRSARWSAREVRVRLCSDEVLAERYALIDGLPAAPGVLTVAAAVQLVLSRIGAVLAPGGDDAPITDPEAAVWAPGVSGWGYLAPLVDAAGLRLWCDERRDWHLRAERTIVPPVVLGDRLVELEQLPALWYDAAVLTYRWTEADGTARERVDSYAAVPVPQSVLTRTIERRYPGPGAARALVDRAHRRRTAATITAMTDLTVTPWRAVTWRTPAGVDEAGVVQRVDFDLARDEMTITTRAQTGA